MGTGFPAERRRWLPVACLLLAWAGHASAAGPAPPPKAPTPVAPAGAAVAKVSAGGILGRAVLGPDGQEIGRVVDVLVDAGGNPRAAVIDFGGFMGLGNRHVAVDWSDMTFPPVGSNGQLKLDLSLDQIRNAPAYTDQTGPASVVEPPSKPAAGH